MSYYVTNENSFLDIKNAHLRVTGNVHTDVLKLGAIEFQPTGSEVTGTVNFTNVTTGVTTSSNLNVGGTLQLGTVEVVATTHTLANTTALGNVTPHTIEVSNVTTGLVTTANVEVGRDLTVTGNVSVGKDLTVTGDVLVSDDLTVTGNVAVTGTGSLTIPSGTMAQRPGTGVAGMIRFNSQSTRLEFYNGTSWGSVGGVSGTGGTITESGGYRYHTFTNASGPFMITSGGVMDVMVVAGGGGGANRDAGGGGAGGLILTMGKVAVPGSYVVVIGAGGAGGVGTGGTNGTNGSNSTFDGTDIVATGGGGGGAQGSNGSNGGSGGGGGYAAPGSGSYLRSDSMEGNPCAQVVMSRFGWWWWWQWCRRG